jgi:CRISPR/Cas system-associated endoribonuclease Cas2
MVGLDYYLFYSIDYDKFGLVDDFLRKLVKPQKDSVRFYWISEEAVSRVLVIGSPPPEKPPNAYIL